MYIRLVTSTPSCSDVGLVLMINGAVLSGAGAAGRLVLDPPPQADNKNIILIAKILFLISIF